MKPQHDTEIDAPAASRPAPGHGVGLLAGRAGRAAADTFGALLFLAPLGLIFDLTGYLPQPLRLFGIYLLLALPLCAFRRREALQGAGALLSVMAVMALVTLPPLAEVFLLAGLHVWVWSRARRVPGRLLQAVAVYALVHTLLFAAPSGYAVLESLNRLASRAVGGVAGGELNLGYTYQNLGSMLLFLTFSIHAWDRTWVSVARTAAFLVVLVLLNGLLAGVLFSSIDLGPDLTWDLNFRDVFSLAVLADHLKRTGILVYPGLVFLAHAGAYLVLHHDTRTATLPHPAPSDSDRADSGRGRRGAAFVFAACAVLLLLAAVPPTTRRATSTAPLVLLDRGVVSFTKPDYGRYSRAAGGMYGFLPDYAGLFGCAGEVVEEIPDPLTPDRILMITNLDEPLSADEFARVWAFVREGGRLWVLGDHTFIKNGRNHVNDLLAPTHIRLNHDSAQFYPQGWFHSFRIRQGTPFAALRDAGENRLSILVGASLDLRPPARPFIIGRFGYGDLGPEEEDPDRGYLGDFEYQTTERLGDLVLVAGEQVGKGKVLVFGDTTSFFNLNLPRAHELLRAVLTWFGEPPAYAWFLGRPAAALAFALLLAALAASLRAADARLAPGSLLLLAVLSTLVHQPSLLPIDRAAARERLALVDFSHQPYASKHANMDTGLFGVFATLMRHDLMPVAQHTWDTALLDEAALLFLNAPREPFGPGARRDVTAFMERGGTVIMTCGYPHYANARSLLEPLGIGIGNVPLGRSFDHTAFGRPIYLWSPWPVETRRQDAQVLAQTDEGPVVIEVPVGAGRLVLISDAAFFHNPNFESLERHALPNIEFFRALLDRTVREAAP